MSESAKQGSLRDLTQQLHLLQQPFDCFPSALKTTPVQQAQILCMQATRSRYSTGIGAMSHTWSRGPQSSQSAGTGDQSLPIPIQPKEAIISSDICQAQTLDAVFVNMSEAAGVPSNFEQ